VAKENLIMCFHASKHFKTYREAQQYKPKVATRPIYVYKILRTNLQSYTELFQYEWGRKYKVRSLDKAIWRDYSTISGRYYHLDVFRGFHAYTTLEKMNKQTQYAFHEYITVRCKIPTGSLYMINRKRDEIVATRIIMPNKDGTFPK
jgi:hypothetical protein